MNKKQLIVTSILLSLMLVLAIAQGFFKEKFRQVALTDNGINQFKEYSFDNDKYIVSLPHDWIVDEKQCEGKYVSCTLTFKDTKNKIKGTLEVINTGVDLNVFAEDDLKNQSLEYVNQEIMPFKTSKNSGVLSQYNTIIKNGYNFKNECYYLNLDSNKTVKVLFNIKQNDYKENIKTVFTTIISSITKIK